MALADLLLLRSLIHSGGVELAGAAAAAATTAAAAGRPVAVAHRRPGLGRFAVGLHVAASSATTPTLLHESA